MLRSLVPSLSEEILQQVAKRQGERYREQYLEAVRPFPGVHATFEALRGMGLPLAIATTCEHDELKAYDKQLNILEITDVVVCGDEVEHGKPHTDLFRTTLRKLELEPSLKVVAVGDTPFDAEAAVSLGLYSLGVLTGGFSREALQAAGCAGVVDTVRESARELSRLRRRCT